MSLAAIDEFRTPRPVAGWRVLLTTFCMALVAWGLGFYSLSVYVQYLSQQGRFSAALLSAATTFHFLVGAAALYAVDAAVARVGRRRVVIGGVLAMAGCASALAYVPNAFWLFAAYAGMAFGWAAISGTAITQIIGSWFAHRRGLALNVALTGASAAGFVVVPALVWAIGSVGLGPGVAAVCALLGLALLGLIGLNLVEPQGTAQAATPSSSPTAASGPVAALWLDRHLLLLCALFGIGWLAQVAFLAQQLPLLVPKIGTTQATIAVDCFDSAACAAGASEAVTGDGADGIGLTARDAVPRHVSHARPSASAVTVLRIPSPPPEANCIKRGRCLEGDV